MKLVDCIRTLLLRIALPKKQFYIQCDGFHSVFHPIMRPVINKELNGTSNEDDNLQQSVH